MSIVAQVMHVKECLWKNHSKLLLANMLFIPNKSFNSNTQPPDKWKTTTKRYWHYSAYNTKKDRQFDEHSANEFTRISFMEKPLNHKFNRRVMFFDCFHAHSTSNHIFFRLFFESIRYIFYRFIFCLKFNSSILFSHFVCVCTSFR